MGLGKIITRDLLFEKYSDIDIFSAYIPDFVPGQSILSPLRDERSPSFTTFQGDNSEWLFKDFGAGFGGDAVKFVSQLYNITYTKAIERIYEDLTFGKVIGTPQEKMELIRPEKKSEIVIIDKPLTKLQHSFLDSFGIKNKEDIINPVKCWYNGKPFNLRKDLHPLILGYIYWHEGLPYYKLYRPYATGKNKWPLSNVKSFMLDYGIKPRKRAVLAKSRKDSRVLDEFVPGEVIGFQAEGLNNFSDEIMQEIMDNTEGDIWLFLDNDPTGKATAQEVQKKWPRVKLLFTPDEVLPLKDPAGVRQKYGSVAIKKILKINGIL